MEKGSYSLDLGENLEQEKKAEEVMKQMQESAEKKEDPKPEPRHEPKQKHAKGILQNDKFIAFVLIIALILLSTQIRMFSNSMPAIDEIVEKSYADSIKTSIAQNIAKEHVGQMDPVYLESETNKKLKEVLSSPESEEELEKMKADYKKIYFDNNGNRYLINYDPYLFLRYAKNIEENGHVGETLKDGKPFDSLRLAPKGVVANKNKMPYYEVYLHKIMLIFNPEITLEGAVIYLPIIFAALSIILIFLITKKLTNNYGGFVAGLIFAIHPVIFGTTRAVDTQVPSIFFSLVTVWLVLWLAETKKISWKTGIPAISLLIVLLLYKETWRGYLYIIIIIISYVFLYLALFLGRKYWAHRKISKKHMMFLAGTILLFAVYFIIQPAFINRVFSRLRLGEQADFYTQGYFMVSELQRVSFSEFIEKMGGYAVCLIALACIFYLLYKSYKNNFKQESKYYLFIVYWFIGLAVVSMLAQRFIAYFGLPFAITLGVGAGLLYPHIEKIPSSFGLHKQKKYIAIVLAIAFILLIVFLLKDPLRQRVYALQSSADDALYDAAMDIKRKSSENAIINTWWDDGYLLQYYAKRGTLFDGGTFTQPALFWISEAFTSKDANYSISIMRMLDCGATNAFSEIAKEQGKPAATGLMREVLKAGRENAKEILKKKDISAGVLDKIFCKNPPEAFIYVSEELVKKYGILQTVAERDLREAEIKKETKGMDAKAAASTMAQKYDLSTEEAYELYSRIHSGETFAENPINLYDYPCTKAKDMLNCAGILLNLTSGEARDAKRKYPYYLATEKNLTKRLDLELDATLIFYQEKDMLKVAAVKSEVRDSFMMQLYFMNAHEIPQLELISHQSSILGNKIKAYKINWDN